MPKAKFELEDSEGDTHEYVVEQTHDPTTSKPGRVGGVELVRRINESAGMPILQLLDKNIAKIIKWYMEAEDDDNFNLDTILGRLQADDVSDVDFELPSAGEALFKTLQNIDLEDTSQQILFHTLRDGKALRKDEIFNRAYSANYSELLQATKQVIEINGFFGLLGTLLEITNQE